MDVLSSETFSSFKSEGKIKRIYVGGNPALCDPSAGCQHNMSMYMQVLVVEFGAQGLNVGSLLCDIGDSYEE